MSSQNNEKQFVPTLSLFTFLKQFKVGIIILLILSISLNALTLILPQITRGAVDSLNPADFTYSRNSILLEYGGIATLIFIITLIQTVLSSIVSEKIAKRLRTIFIEKVSKQSFTYIQDVTVQKLLTNITSDIDAVKAFISQGIVLLFSSVVLLIGSTIILISTNWKLGIPIVLTIPALMGVFTIVFSRVSKYFKAAQEVIDSLNLVINETIVGAGLIRVLNAHTAEENRFKSENRRAQEIGINIVNGFAIIVPFINLFLNLGILIVVGYGGKQIIEGSLSAGEYSSFFNYVSLFITPIIVLGFLGSTVSRAFASYSRIMEIVEAPIIQNIGQYEGNIKGEIQFKNVSFEVDGRKLLNNISLTIKAGTKNAILGPTASGKSLLLYLLSGLIEPTSGEILIDNVPVKEYRSESLYSQIAIVFQDSLIFNSTIRENLTFNSELKDEELIKALQIAELWEYINSLPDKLESKIAERGATLSGGQKQRLTLARALILQPKILLLDDFTARVDIQTEKTIFRNLKNEFKNQTLLSITQKIEPIKEYDQIIVIMEGEILDIGNHNQLLERSFEYQQIYNSQKSTEQE